MALLRLGAALLTIVSYHRTCSSPTNTAHNCSGSQPNANHAGLTNCTDYTPAKGYIPLAASRRPPVMFVPSMLGSYLQRKLHNSHEPYPICSDGGWMGGADWTNMFPPAGLDPHCHDAGGSVMSCLPTDLFPMYADCWAHDLTMVYNPATDTYADPPGVTIRADGSLPITTDNSTSILPEYMCMANMLKSVGYQAQTEYDSLGYDWRKSPGDWMAAGGYFSQLKVAIEQLRARNAGRPVVVVSFSLGGPVFNVFLTRYVTQTWKDANIKSWISTSGTFGGVQESLMQQIGYNGSFTVSTMSEESSVAMMQSWGSQNWMGSTLAPNDVVVNVTGTRYQVLGKDVAQLFDLIRKPNLKVASIKNALSSSTPAPGIEAYIVAGEGYGTPRTYEYPPDASGRPDFAQGPILHCTDGDSVATSESLTGGPSRWGAQGTQLNRPVHITTLPGAGHGDTAADERTIKILYQMLSQ